MRRTLALTLAAAMLALAGCATAGGGGSADASDPLGLIRERCTVCHDTSRIAAAKHDAAGWRSTVDRMRDKGAKLTAEEADAVVDFLSGGGNQQL